MRQLQGGRPGPGAGGGHSGGREKCELTFLKIGMGNNVNLPRKIEQDLNV